MKRTDRSVFEGLLDLLQPADGGPALGDQAVVGHIKVTHVQGVVDGLDLLDLDDPGAQLFLSTHQDSHAVILGLVQNLEIPAVIREGADDTAQ